MITELVPTLHDTQVEEMRSSGLASQYLSANRDLEPVPGTAAFTLRETGLASNDDVFIILCQIETLHPLLRKVGESYLEMSKKKRLRPMVWDILCAEHHLPVDQFIGHIAAYLQRNERAKTFITIAQNENDVVKNLAENAKEAKNFKHTELFTELSGIKQKEGPQIVINTGPQTAIVGTERGLPMLEETLRSHVDSVRKLQGEMLNSPREVEGEIIEDAEVREVLNGRTT